MQPAIGLNVPLVYIEVKDAFNDATGPSSYGEKHGIDEQALLGKLRALGPVADHAPHDAINRWWDAGHDHTTAGWATVGLKPGTADPGDAANQGKSI